MFLEAPPAWAQTGAHAGTPSAGAAIAPSLGAAGPLWNGLSQVRGTYTGAMSCSGQPVTFQLLLQADPQNPLGTSATWTVLSGDTGSGRRGMGEQPATWRATYDASTSQLTLRGGAGSSQGMVGLVLPEGVEIVFTSIGRARADCTLAVAVRGDKLPVAWSEVIARAPASGSGVGGRTMGSLGRLTGKLGNLLRGTDCTREMMEWIGLPTRQPTDRVRFDDLMAMRLMFSDEAFVPAFGAPFRDLASGDIDNLNERMRECMKSPQLRSAGGRVAAPLISAFMDLRQFSHVEKNAGALSIDALRRWARAVQQQVAGGVAQSMNPAVPDAISQAAAPLTAHLWPEERQTFERTLADFRRPLAVAWLNASIDQLGAQASADAGTWESLAASVQRAREPFPYLTPDDLHALAQRLEPLVSSRLVALVESSSSPAGVDAPAISGVVEWPARHPRLWQLAGADARAAAMGVIDARRQNLVQVLIDSQRQLFAQRLRGLPPAAALAEAVSFEGTVATTIGPFQSDPAAQRFAQERSTQRQALLGRHADSVVAAIHGAATASAADQLRRASLWPEDEATPAGQRVMQALTRRTSELAAQARAAEEQERRAAQARQAQEAERERAAQAARQAQAQAALDRALAADAPKAGRRSVEECQALAAHPYESGRYAIGTAVAYIRLDAARAVPACAAAVAQSRGDLWSLVRYCRALDKAGRKPESFAACQVAADGGNPVAAYLVGAALIDGSGFAKDAAAGFDWMLKSAQAGMGWAQGAVSEYYWEGRLAPKDPRAAMLWLQRSAQNGNPVALYNLAVHYSNGRTVARDRSRADQILVELLKSMERDPDADADLLKLVRDFRRQLAGQSANDDARQREADWQEQREKWRMQEEFMRQSRELERR